MRFAKHRNARDRKFLHSVTAWQTGAIVRKGAPRSFQTVRRATTACLLAAILFSAGPSAPAALNDSLKPTFASARSSKWIRPRNSSRDARLERLLKKKDTHIPAPITLAPPIEGRVSANGFVNGFTNAQIYLVRPLDPETEKRIAEGARIFASLRAKPGLDLNKTVIAPANAIPLQKALADVKAALPKAAVRDMQIAQVGALKIAPSGPLVSKYSQKFLTMEPVLIRRDLRTISELLRDDMMEQEKILGVGYLGSIQEINFFGLVRESGGVDVAQARKIAQAAVDQLWLTELCEYVAQADQKAAQTPLKTAGQLSPEESWNAFYLTQFNDLDFQLQLRVLDITTPGPKGEFRLWGDGQIIVGITAYQQLVYVPEGLGGVPIQITRLNNGNGKERK